MLVKIYMDEDINLYTSFWLNSFTSTVNYNMFSCVIFAIICLYIIPAHGNFTQNEIDFIDGAVQAVMKCKNIPGKLIKRRAATLKYLLNQSAL